jgi:hypothetical protein
MRLIVVPIASLQAAEVISMPAFSGWHSLPMRGFSGTLNSLQRGSATD